MSSGEDASDCAGDRSAGIIREKIQPRRAGGLTVRNRNVEKGVLNGGVKFEACDFREQPGKKSGENLSGSLARLGP